MTRKAFAVSLSIVLAVVVIIRLAASPMTVDDMSVQQILITDTISYPDIAERMSDMQLIKHNQLVSRELDRTSNTKRESIWKLEKAIEAFGNEIERRKINR